MLEHKQSGKFRPWSETEITLMMSVVVSEHPEERRLNCRALRDSLQWSAIVTTRKLNIRNEHFVS